MFRRDIIAAVKILIPLIISGMVLAGCGGEPAPTMQSKAPAAPAAPAAPKAPDENAALDALLKTVQAQATHFKVNRRYALTFDELLDTRLLSSAPTAAATGYEFKLRPSADAQMYTLAVDPADSGAAAARHFFADQTGVIRVETGKVATAQSPGL